MRNLASALGVEAMSLYHHVANKEALLDGVVERVVQEIEEEIGGFTVDPSRRDWMPIVRERVLAARRVMLRHPWAPSVVETRTSMPPVLMQLFDSMVGVFAAGGFSHDLSHHAIHAMGSRFLGFSQELFTPDSATGAVETPSMEEMAAQLPHLVAMLTEVAHDDPESTIGWCDDQTEFEFVLELLLEGLERRRVAESRERRRPSPVRRTR